MLIFKGYIGLKNKFEIIVLFKTNRQTNRNMSSHMDSVNIANMKWHGSTTGILEGGKIQEDIDELYEVYGISKNYEMEFLSKEGITQKEKNLFYFLRAVGQKMYDGAQHCEEEIVFSKDEEITALQDEKEELRNQIEGLEEKLERLTVTARQGLEKQVAEVSTALEQLLTHVKNR